MLYAVLCLAALSLIVSLIVLFRLAALKPVAPDFSPVEEKVNRLQNEIALNRKETLETLMSFNRLLTDSVDKQSEKQREALDRIRESVEKKIIFLQEDNAKKLDAMRETVDTKLQTTLEKRLTESFKLVSERLETVQKGLGEMRKLAGDVDSLQRIMSNVKARGIFGEYVLENIVSELFTVDQYVKIFTIPNTRLRVEFALKLPGKSTDSQVVYLPIDSKFPREDYERLMQASENANAAALESAKTQLLRAVEKAAGDVSSKYVNPPHTTDFAILFLPTEGLYAEVLREPGFHQKLRTQLHVLVAGPTTLAALLNALSIGFRTLAVEQRSMEVWKILGGVKTEFLRFGECFKTLQKQFATLSGTLDKTYKRTEKMQRQLRDVEAVDYQSDASETDESILEDSSESESNILAL